MQKGKKLRCAVKFCGGCNPRYDRGAAYREMEAALADVAGFETARAGSPCDVLLIIRGCTQCPYLYEEIEAAHRVVCTDESMKPEVIRRIRAFADEV